MAGVSLEAPVRRHTEKGSAAGAGGSSLIAPAVIIYPPGRAVPLIILPFRCYAKT